jgi:tripartite-type tricarboxylate transporter receptor subunit TctC
MGSNMKTTVRITIRAIAFCIGALMSPTVVLAFPDRPITIIVPSSPGGSTDLMARIMGQKLTERWGQPVVVSNIAGAGGSIGAARAAKASADGHTWLMSTNSPLTTNLALYKGLDYDTERDFVSVTMIAQSPMLLVANPKLGVRTVKDLVEAAKKDPGKIAVGISGFGAGTHLAISEFSRLTGTKFTIVPYRGGPPMLAAMISGEEVLVGFSDIVPALPLVRDGKLLAVATPLLQRSAAAPEVPTIEEAGVPRIDVTSWNGIFIPKSTPADIAKRINAEVNRIFSEPDVRQKIEAIGQNPVPAMSQEQFAAFVQNEIPRWREIVRNANIDIQAVPAQ